MRFIDRDEVRERLTYDLCIPLVRKAMIAFSRGETRQHLRSILPLGPKGVFRARWARARCSAPS